MSPAWGWTKASHWPGECATFTLQDRSGHNKITISFHNVKNTLPFEGFKNLYVDVAAGHTHPVDDRPQPQLDGLIPSVEVFTAHTKDEKRDQDHLIIVSWEDTSIL